MMRSTPAISTPASLATQSADPVTFSTLMKGTEMSTRFQSVTAGITSKATETITVDPEGTMYLRLTNSVVDKTVIGNNKDSGGSLDEKVLVIAGAFVGGLVIVVIIVIICVLVFTSRCQQPSKRNSEEHLSQPSNSHNITRDKDHPQYDLVFIQPVCDESRPDASDLFSQVNSIVRVHHLQDMEKRIRGDISQTGNQLGKQVAEFGDQVADLGDELAEHGNQHRNSYGASVVHTSSSRTETVL